MNNEFESLERLKTAPSFMGGTVEYKSCSNSASLLLQDYEIVRRALLELQFIKESSPKEALRGIIMIKDQFYNDRINKMGLATLDGYYNIIKQVLLKTKEIEKVLKIIFEKNVDIEWFKMRKKWTETLENQYKSYCKYIENNSYWSSLTQEEFDTLKRYCDE